MKQQHCRVDINRKTNFNKEQHIITHNTKTKQQHRNKIFSSSKKIKERTLQVMKQHRNAMKFSQLKKLTKAQ